jgi:hypothetical protein
VSAAAVQLPLAVFSLAAVALSQNTSPRRRTLAPVFGLAAQPLWLWSTLEAGQWGMVLLPLAYIAVWTRSLCTSVRGWCAQRAGVAR